jgi:hypothetical protein
MRWRIVVSHVTRIPKQSDTPVCPQESAFARIGRLTSIR